MVKNFFIRRQGIKIYLAFFQIFLVYKSGKAGFVNEENCLW